MVRMNEALVYNILVNDINLMYKILELIRIGAWFNLYNCNYHIYLYNFIPIRYHIHTDHIFLY